jgi:hypothetical protein
MIRNDEVFFQIERGGAGVKPAAAATKTKSHKPK